MREVFSSPVDLQNPGLAFAIIIYYANKCSIYYEDYAVICMNSGCHPQPYDSQLPLNQLQQNAQLFDKTRNLKEYQTRSHFPSTERERREQELQHFQNEAKVAEIIPENSIHRNASPAGRSAGKISNKSSDQMSLFKKKEDPKTKHTFATYTVCFSPVVNSGNIFVNKVLHNTDPENFYTKMPERNQHPSEASFVNNCTFNKQVQLSLLRNQKQLVNGIKA